MYSAKTASARLKSLFNAEYGHKFNLEIEPDIDEFNWSVGVVVGPSGSGKTSIGRTFFDGKIFDLKKSWSIDKPIIDDINPSGDFNAVTSALSAVGLGRVPSWRRPFKVLSNGEKFRAGLARLLLTGQKDVVLLLFTASLKSFCGKNTFFTTRNTKRCAPGRGVERGNLRASQLRAGVTTPVFPFRKSNKKIKS